MMMQSQKSSQRQRAELSGSELQDEHSIAPTGKAGRGVGV